MTTYPVELNLADRPVLIVGGGDVAARRAEALTGAGATLRVVSLLFVPELEQLPVERVLAAYTPEAIGVAKLVFACTDDPLLNARIAADARAAGALCNIADDPENSDFIMPAVLRRGSLTLAVGTAGASPLLAARIRDELESQFGPDSGILVDELQRARIIVRQQVSDPAARRNIHAILAGSASAELLRTRGRDAWRDWLSQLLTSCATGSLPASAAFRTAKESD